MRITCPNCGAQYEVPDQVIPDEGRDVQCSNCGNTWFQEHPDHTNSGDDDRELIAEPSNEPENEPDPQPETDPRPEPEPEPEFDDEIDEEPAHAEEDTPEPQARELDPEVADILREEAELETRLRESEASVGIESQNAGEIVKRFGVPFALSDTFFKTGTTCPFKVGVESSDRFDDGFGVLEK